MRRMPGARLPLAPLASRLPRRPARHARGRGTADDRRGHRRLRRRRRAAVPRAAVHPAVPAAGRARVPRARRHRPERLPGVRVRPPGLPELRQGDGPVLPVRRLPLLAAELDALGSGRHLEVPVLLPDGRRHGVRDHRGARAAPRLPEHLRVLLHRLRGRPAALGPPPVQPSHVDPHRGRDLDLRQAAAGVLDPRRPAGLHRHLAGRAVVRPARRHGGARRASRSCGSSCGLACCRRTGRGASRPTRCPRRWTLLPSATPGPPRT